MPPHCDSLDGPVVGAARHALEADDVDLVLPFAPEDAEPEIRSVFDAVRKVRALGDDAREVADRLFFETVVRLHRAGEGAPYNGLKPAGLDVGPVIPLAEKAVTTGEVAPVADYLAAELHHQLEHRLERVGSLATTKDRSVADARAWVEAMLGFQVYSHQLLKVLQASPHGEGHAHDHG
jgi:hypothetical protein